MVQEAEKPIFKDGVFAIVISKDLPRIQAEELQDTLEKRGGEVQSLDEALDLRHLTHIISSSIDFPDYHKARERMISVVVPNWIMASLVKNKDAQVRPYTPDPNLIFSNVTLACADIPIGDQDAIIGAVLAMGGMESSTVTKMTTHICALTMDHPKCQAAREKGLKCKILLPHWFDDCLKLGKRISEEPYLLPDPEVFRKTSRDDVPFPSTETIQGAIVPHPDRLPVPTETPMRRLDVFQSKTVMLAKDLDFNTYLRKTLEDLVEGGGGIVTNTVHEADMYVGRWREGRDYVFASRAGIDVGNLSWLYYLITYNVWTSPLKRLLHYPLPREGIPGFKDMKVTLSNYAGESRVYLESLITATGAEFTKSMKQDNTHLITARDTSEKCVAAKEWSIEMVNHLWIEESYARCVVQPLTDPRYTHFPPRTNLSEIIGQTSFDANFLEQKYYSKDPTPSPGDSHPLRKPMLEKDRNSSGSKKVDSDTVMGGMKTEVEIGKTPAGRQKSRTSIHQASTPASDRQATAGKENDTPVSTGSRSAKSRAVSRISGLAPDIALYEKEKKRKGPVWGGERAANRIDKEKSTERSSSPAMTKSTEAQDEESEEETKTRTPKRLKTGLPEVSMRLLITGYKGWIDAPHKEDLDKKKLRELGILVISEPSHCSHLAAPYMVRTKKFLCALASGPMVLSTDFIDACIKKKELRDPEDFLLKDTNAEKKFKLKLKDAVARAKSNKRHLLKLVPIYSTNALKNGWETYRDIVLANGGNLTLYTGRPIVKKISPEDDDGPAEPIYLISGESTDEKKLWTKFTKAARDGNMVPKIVSADWILDVAMSQQLKSTDAYLLKAS